MPESGFKPPSGPRFRAGDPVCVRQAYPIGHCRTPAYIRRVSGIIERYCGSFPNPEELAYGRDGLPAVPLYRVRALMGQIWPDYQGGAIDTVEVEVFEHWLLDANDPLAGESGRSVSEKTS